MNRRDFVRLAGSGVTGASIGSLAEAVVTAQVTKAPPVPSERQRVEEPSAASAFLPMSRRNCIPSKRICDAAR